MIHELESIVAIHAAGAPEATPEAIFRRAAADPNIPARIDFHTFVEALGKFFSLFEVSADQIDAVSKYAQDLFDKYVVPYDVPGVPEWLERIAEQTIRRQIPEIVSALWRRVKPDPKSGVPKLGDVGAKPLPAPTSPPSDPSLTDVPLPLTSGDENGGETSDGDENDDPIV